MEITKREILASLSIIAILFLIGFLISDKIADAQNDRNEVYNKAVKISDNSEQFQYGMRTNIGNAFVYGNIFAVDTVTYSEIGGAYMYVKKVKERYTQHERTVTYTTGSGSTKQTHTKVKTYWTWDKVGEESKKCNEISFCRVVFPSSKFQCPTASYIETIKESSKVRYKYYGTDSEFSGTIFTVLADNTISDNSKVYVNQNIAETVDFLTSFSWVVVFWIFWTLLIIGCVYGFYYLDNEWLK